MTLKLVATFYDAHKIGFCPPIQERLLRFPGDNWGSYTGDDIDFMHFQGAGHRLVAEALLPHVEEMLAGRAGR